MKSSSLSLAKYALAAFLTLLFGTAYSQYPATGNKQRLGWQTTGDGLVWRGAIADTSTLDPSGLNNAWMLIDTASGNLYAYRQKAWRLVSGGGGGGGGVTMPFDSVTFNVNEGDASERELKYSAEKGYLQYGGEDSVQIPILPGIWYVRNDTSVTIPKGTVVRATGTLGASGRIKVKHMIADGSIPAMYVLGIAMQDIVSGADGYVMTQGKIRQVNTTAYSEEAVLYADVDTLGGLTQTEPGNGYLKLPIAFVVHSASNGTLAVRVDAGSSLRDLHDVDTTGKVNRSVLQYNNTLKYWKASTTAGIVAGDTAAMLTNYVNIADTAAMLSSYISNADTSVFARDFQVSGSTWYLPRFKNTNSLENSPLYNPSGNKIMLGHTSGNVFSTGIEVHSATSDTGPAQSSVDVYHGASVFDNFTGRFQINRSRASSVGSFTKVNNGDWLGRYMFNGADGAKYVTGAQIYAITDATTGLDSMPTALRFATNPGNTSIPTDRMSITSAGRVGIGTASPSRTLHVTGEARISDLTTDTPTQIVGADADGDLGAVALGTGLSIASGTLNTSAILPADTSVFARDWQIAGTADYLPKFTGASSVGNSVLYETGNSLILGQTTPLYNVSRFSIAYTPVLTGGPIIADTRSASTPGTPRGAYWDFGGKYGNSDTITTFGRIGGYREGGTASVSPNGYIAFDVNDGSEYSKPSGGAYWPVEKMRITSTGRVGIATTSPDSTLHVVGDAKITGGASFVNGDVSIGPKLANTAFSVHRTYAGTVTNPIRSVIQAYVPNNSINAYNLFKGVGGNTLAAGVIYGLNLEFINTNGGSYGIYSQGESQNYFSGKVGIATSSPSRTLHIAATDAVRIPAGTNAQRTPSGVTNAIGDLRYNTEDSVENIEWYDITGAYRRPVISALPTGLGTAGRFAYFKAGGLDTSAVLTQSNGRIGIGTASPDSLLTVTGGIRATRDIYARRLRLNSFTTQVVDISNYAADSSFGQNIYIGTTGLTNSYSGGGVTTLNGSLNTSIGFQALNANTTGWGNAAVGRRSLFNNNTGAQNTGVGEGSLAANTSGQLNTAVGNGCITRNTIGSSNTGVGVGSLTFLTSGSSNTGVGESALAFLTTSSENTAVGYLAGGFAGSGTTQNKTSSSSTYIGYQARAGADGNSGEIVIGKDAVGNGSNTVTIGGSTTTGTYFQYGETYIGTATDNGAFALQVGGTGYFSTGLRVDYTAALDANTIFQMPNTSTKAAKGYAWATYSDARIKSNFDTIQNALQAVQALKPVYYDQHDSEVIDGKIKLQDSKTRTVGFIAQDVAPVIPAAVQAGNDTQLWGMDYTKLIPYLTKAIQEQQAQIEALKKEIEALKNK